MPRVIPDSNNPNPGAVNKSWICIVRIASNESNMKFSITLKTWALREKRKTRKNSQCTVSTDVKISFRWKRYVLWKKNFSSEAIAKFFLSAYFRRERKTTEPTYLSFGGMRSSLKFERSISIGRRRDGAPAGIPYISCQRTNGLGVVFVLD